MKALKIRQVALATALLRGLAPAAAQDWPTRNVTVVVPIPAGVASDIIARVVFEQVGKQVGQNFVIENRPGAGGTIGANMVAKAAPDGHTILVYGSIAASNALYSHLPYDTLNDFAPVVLFGQTPLVVGAPGATRRSPSWSLPARPSPERSTIRRSASVLPRISAPSGWRSVPASRRSTSRSRAANG